MPTFDSFRAEVTSLASFHCPAYEPGVYGDPGDERIRRQASNAHHAEHPTRQQCAAAIVGRLFSIENQTRRIAWSYAFKPTVHALLSAIREHMARLEHEHDLMSIPRWTLDQVIAGGPGYERRWTGYHR